MNRFTAETQIDILVMAITSAREHRAQNGPLTKGGTAMLAEIFMLRLEANARTGKEAITRSASQFVPIIFPAVGSTQVLSTPVISLRHEQSVGHPLLKMPDDRSLASGD